MKRDDFINELERLLRDIPEGDRLDAIEYYYDYFDEAGIENEQKVIRELGSPESVAQTIKENLRAESYESTNEYGASGVYGNSGDYNEPRDYSAPEEETGKRGYEETKTYNTAGAYENMSSASQDGMPGKKTSWVLIVIIAVLTFPLWIGIVAGLFGGVIGLIAGLFGLTIGLLGAAFGLIVGGITCCVAILFRAAFVGQAELMITIGVGALLVALGLLLALLSVWLVGKWIPSLVKVIVKGIKNLSNRK